MQIGTSAAGVVGAAWAALRIAASTSSCETDSDMVLASSAALRIEKGYSELLPPGDRSPSCQKYAVTENTGSSCVFFRDKTMCTTVQFASHPGSTSPKHTALSVAAHVTVALFRRALVSRDTRLTTRMWS